MAEALASSEDDDVADLGELVGAAVAAAQDGAAVPALIAALATLQAADPTGGDPAAAELMASLRVADK